MSLPDVPIGSTGQAIIDIQKANLEQLKEWLQSRDELHKIQAERDELSWKVHDEDARNKNLGITLGTSSVVVTYDQSRAQTRSQIAVSCRYCCSRLTLV